MFWKLSYRSKPFPKIDLHVHTTASDGKLPPREVVRLAYEKGICYLAITDHDTVEGLQEAAEEASKYQPHLHFIPGIEFSTLFEAKEIHLLGYQINWTSRDFLTELTGLQEARKTRVQKMVDRLSQMGLPVRLQEVEQKAQGSSIGRPHIALVLKERGIVKSVDEGFKNYLTPGCPAFVPRFKLSPFAAIDLVRAAGGIPVLAHPGLECPTELIPKLIKHGLQGIEVYHPKNGPEQKAQYLELAAKHHLLITGGSDFHGHEEEDYADFGAMRVPLYTARFLKRRS